MDEKEWKLFISQFPEEYKQMLQDSDFQNAVLRIYADSKSEADAHTKIRELVNDYKLKTFEADMWLRTHPFLKLKIYTSCIIDKIKRYANKHQ